MPIIPSEHFDFLKEQRTNERQNALLNQQQMNNLVQSMEVNKAFNQFAQDKDAAGFTKRMRTLGTLFGNDRLANFEVPDYLHQTMGTMQRPIENPPEGFETVGFDQKGYPMIRKKKEITPQDQKAMMDLEDRQKSNQAKAELVKSSAQDALNTISEIKKGIKYFGAAGNIPPLPGEYHKVNWRANFDKLVNTAVINVMNSLKEASKSGATGFGALSDKELGLLQGASTVLRTDMSEEDATRYLNAIEAIQMKILNNGQTSNGDNKSSNGSYSYLWD